VACRASCVRDKKWLAKVTKESERITLGH